MHTRTRTVGKICEIFDLAAQIFSTLSRAAFRLGHTLQFRICKWVRMNKWVNEWMNVCMNGKSENLHNNSNGKQTLSAETRQVASGYEVTKSSCSRCTFTRREEETERGKRYYEAGRKSKGGIQSGISEIGDSKETERGVQRRATELQLLHPQFSFNWLSPQAKMHKKWKTMQDVAEWQSGKQSRLQLGACQIWFRCIFIAKTENRWKLSDKKV